MVGIFVVDMKINININVRETLKRYRRVLQVAKKPTMIELKRTTRICGIGFIIIGVIGFLFYLISVFGGG